jgi:hypothetical protein
VSFSLPDRSLLTAQEVSCTDDYPSKKRLAMISAARAWNHTRRPATLLGRIGIAALALSLPVRTARGSQQERINESRVLVPAVGESAFAGEIEYAFDTALNKTRARFRAPLGSRSLLSRIFVGSPVHTIVAAYEFGGRTAVDRPDSIRLSLMSDEYMDASPGYRPTLGAQPILLITFGDSVALFPLGIAQRTEVWSAPEPFPRVNNSSPGSDTRANSYRGVAQVHIERTATAWLRTCELLALTSQKDVHGTVAGLDFELSEEVIAGLRQFAAGLAPSAVGRIGVSCGSK